MKKILAVVFTICLLGAFLSISLAGGPLDTLKDKMKEEEIDTKGAESEKTKDSGETSKTDTLKEKVQEKAKTEGEKLKEKMNIK